MINLSVLYQELEHNLLSKNDVIGQQILPKNERQIRELLALSCIE